MTIRTTRWSPDTCKCVLEYTWDDTQSENTRTHNISNVVSKCPVHQTLNTNTDIWNVIMEENPRKNNAFKHFLDRAPTSIYDLDIDGVTRKLKGNISVDFNWSGTVPNRVLTITVTGTTLNNSQRNGIQNFLNNQFGAGRVILG